MAGCDEEYLLQELETAIPIPTRGGKERVQYSKQGWEAMQNAYDEATYCRGKPDVLTAVRFRELVEVHLKKQGYNGMIPTKRAFQKRLICNPRIKPLYPRKRVKVEAGPKSVSPDTANEEVDNMLEERDNMLKEDGGKIQFACGHWQCPEFLGKLSRLEKGHTAERACPTCETGAMAASEQIQRDNALLRVMEAQKGTMRFAWPDAVQTVPMEGVKSLLGKIPKKLADCPDFHYFVNSVAEIRHIDLGVVSSPAIETSKTKGANHPTADQFKYSPHQLLDNPSDGTIGVVSWTPSDGDGTAEFAIIGPFQLRNDSIVAIGKRESSLFTEMPKATRPGTAGGVFVCSVDRDFDCGHLSVVTKDKREFFYKANSKSTNVTWCSYENSKTGKVVQSMGWTYNDVSMVRQNKTQKRRDVLANEDVQAKEVAEMTSRVAAAVVTVALGLVGGKAKREALKCLKEAISTVCRANPWSNTTYGDSLWKCVMLEYSCKSGEMRNHEALKCHVDGNKSHWMESMTLFPKVAANDDRPSSEIMRYVERVPGVLSFPFLGFGMRMRCGRDVLHLKLKDTPHVADGTRGVYNWSWVHGP